MLSEGAIVPEVDASKIVHEAFHFKVIGPFGWRKRHSSSKYVGAWTDAPVKRRSKGTIKERVSDSRVYLCVGYCPLRYTSLHSQ